MITVYTKTACPRCRMTQKLLDGEGMDYQTVNVEGNEDVRDDLVSHGFRSLPVTVQEGMTPEEYIVGFQPDRLKTLGR